MISACCSTHLGVLLDASPSPILPIAGFSLHDDETLTGEQLIDNPEEVGAHVNAFEVAWNAAVVGPDAVALIQRVTAELHG